jgi:hypothetical protein
MKQESKGDRRSEQGIALLIAIFVLLLISVVAIALLVSSGTETALGANYRTSSTVYYAALAGLEEARGRLLPRDPNYFGASFISPGSTLPLYHTIYVINRNSLLQETTIVPWDPGDPYYDKEYQNEFGIQASAATPNPISSLWDNNNQHVPGPIFKWVRITAATEKSLYLDVDADGVYDSNTLIYYDPGHLDTHSYNIPGLIKTLSPPPSAVQALQITALAALPNGGKKVLQYLVAPINLMNFPAALTFSGTNVGNSSTYPIAVPSSGSFYVEGTDQFSPNGCTPGPNPVAAIGYTQTGGGDTSQSNINAAIAAGGHPGNYPGSSAAPSVSPVAPLLAANLQSVIGLDSLVQSITRSADVVLNGPLTQSDSSNYMPPWMSLANPAIVVVNGDLTFSGWHATGYGILLVTGQFTFDPDANWDGIVLVIGKGIMYSHQGGVGQFRGAVFLATTVDAANNPLPPFASLGSPTPLGSPTFDFTSGSGGSGIYYSSCWVKYLQSTLTYKVLSFREIQQ